jgi:hypothetical protein
MKGIWKTGEEEMKVRKGMTDGYEGNHFLLNFNADFTHL